MHVSKGVLTVARKRAMQNTAEIREIARSHDDSLALLMQTPGEDRVVLQVVRVIGKDYCPVAVCRIDGLQAEITPVDASLVATGLVRAAAHIAQKYKPSDATLAKNDVYSLATVAANARGKGTLTSKLTSRLDLTHASFEVFSAVNTSLRSELEQLQVRSARLRRPDTNLDARLRLAAVVCAHLHQNSRTVCFNLATCHTASQVPGSFQHYLAQEHNLTFQTKETSYSFFTAMHQTDDGRWFVVWQPSLDAFVFMPLVVDKRGPLTCCEKALRAALAHMLA